MLKKLRLQTLTIPWNLFLISAGSFIFAIGVKAVAMPQEFISGGMSGLIDCDERLRVNVAVSTGNELTVTMDEYLDFVNASGIHPHFGVNTASGSKAT